MTTDLARRDDHGTDLAVANREEAAGALAHILATGDLSKLSNEQRVAYYLDYCGSLGLNPRSRPFDWIEFYDPETQGKKLQLYLNQSGAAQLRRQHQISVHFTRREPIGGNTDEPMFVCEVEGTTPNGRVGIATKYVPLTGMNRQRQKYRLSGQALANAYMKAETGALRRLVVSMVGLASPPDPEEVRGARFVVVDGAGRVLDNPTQEQRYLAQTPAAAAAIGEPTYETTGRAEDAPLAGTPEQTVRADELEPPKSDGPRPSFRASDEDVERWRGRWFASVRGTSLDTDEARHRFVADWTRDELEWPKGKQTESLTTFLRRASSDEAERLLAHVWAICDDERRSYLEDADAGRQEGSRHPDQRVHDSVQLTGGPATDDDQADDGTAF